MTKVLSNAQTAASVSPVGAATIKNPEQVTSFKADTCSLPHASRYELIKICFSVGGAGFTRTCRHVARPDSYSLAVVLRGRIHTHLPSCGEAGFILTCRRVARPDSYSLAIVWRGRIHTHLSSCDEAGFTRTCRHVARPDSYSLVVVGRGRIHTHLPSCCVAAMWSSRHAAQQTCRQSRVRPSLGSLLQSGHDVM